MPPRGNRYASKGADDSPGPWAKWPETDRAKRAIRWIETYCIPPKGYGSGEPMRLAEFQKAWIRNILAPGIRSAVLSLPRGNGKSTLLAALALWAVFDPDEGGAPQVPVVATTVMQAVRACYAVALEMVASHPELDKRAIRYSAIGATKLRIPSTKGEMFPVSSDVDGLQGLDPSVAVCDEIGFQPIESWDALLLASGKRPRSLVIGIGTPGLDRDNALWQLRSRVREGVTLPGFVYTEYAADEECEFADELQWAKANPALAEGFMDIDALRTAVMLSPEGHFRLFRLGQWVDGVDSWLGPSGRMLWDGLLEPYDFVAGRSIWVGVDVGLKRDSTAVVMVQRDDEGMLHATCRLWIPGEDQPVDVTDVMAHLRDLSTLYHVQAISFDPRFFDVPAKMLADEGLPLMEVPQSVDRMTSAVGTLFELIKRSELRHWVSGDGNGVFATHVLNAVPRFNERGFTLQKSKSRGRIDAVIALALAVDRALHSEPLAEPMFSWG